MHFHLFLTRSEKKKKNQIKNIFIGVLLNAHLLHGVHVME